MHARMGGGGEGLNGEDDADASVAVDKESHKT